MERIESFCYYSETESLLLLGESLLSLADSADSLLLLGESLPSTRRKFAITRRKKVCSRLLESMLLLGESFVTTQRKFVITRKTNCCNSEIVGPQLRERKFACATRTSKIYAWGLGCSSLGVGGNIVGIDAPMGVDGRCTLDCTALSPKAHARRQLYYDVYYY